MSSLRSFYFRASRGHVLFPDGDEADDQESLFVPNNQDQSRTNNSRPSIVRQLICRKENTLDPVDSIHQWTMASDPATKAAQAEASENVAAANEQDANLRWLPKQQVPGPHRYGIIEAAAAAPVKNTKEQQRKTFTKKRQGSMRRTATSDNDQKNMQRLVARARRAISQPTLLGSKNKQWQQEQAMYIFHDATVNNNNERWDGMKSSADREQEKVDDLLERARRQVTPQTNLRQEPTTDNKEQHLTISNLPLDDHRENDTSLSPSQTPCRDYNWLERSRRERLPPWASDTDQSRSMFSERSDNAGSIEGLAASRSIADTEQKSTAVVKDDDCESWVVDQQLDLSTKTLGDQKDAYDCDAVDQLEISMKTLSDNSLLSSHPSSSTKSKLPPGAADIPSSSTKSKLPTGAADIPSSSTKSKLPTGAADIALPLGLQGSESTRRKVRPFNRNIFSNDKTLLQNESRMSTEQDTSSSRPTVLEDILSLLDKARLKAEQEEESLLNLSVEEEESLLNLTRATVEEGLFRYQSPRPTVLEDILPLIDKTRLKAEQEEESLLNLSVEEEESLLNLTRATVEEDLFRYQSPRQTVLEDILSLLDKARLKAEQPAESLLNLSVEEEESLLNLSRATVEEDLFRYQMEFRNKTKHQEPQNIFDEDRDTSHISKVSHSATDAPYPIHGILPSNRILTLPLMEALRGYLPSKDHNYWIKFSKETDTQASVQSMLDKIRGSCDTIICVQSPDGSVFGSFTRLPWELQTGWYGDYHDGSFLFRVVQGRSMEVFPNTGNDNYVQYCTRHAMAVGGGDWQSDFPHDSQKETRGIGLIIDGDLTGGESNCCATFANPRLAHGEDEYGNEFVIAKMEVWTLTPDKSNGVN